MGTLRSCDRLRHDHDVIGNLLCGMDVLLERAHARRAVPSRPFAGAVEFFSAFVERCHEPMEDEELLPVLDRYALADRDSLARVRAEHEEARRLLAMLRPLSGRRRVNGEASSLLDAYVALLRRHMASENEDVLPAAERVMSPADDASLERGFARIERRALGSGGRGVMMALADAVTHACRAVVTRSVKRAPEMIARDVMRPDPRSVAPDQSLAHAADAMASLGTREIPVVDAGALVGILTRTDMEPYRGHYEWTTVRTAMTADPVTVPPEASLRVVAALLLDRTFNSVPVVSGGKLVGMIARRDVLRALAQESP